MIEEVQDKFLSQKNSDININGNYKYYWEVHSENLQSNIDLKMQSFEQKLQTIQQRLHKYEKEGNSHEIERKSTNQILIDQIERELSQAPSIDQGANEKCVQNWKRLKPLTIDDIKKYWHKAELEVNQPQDELAEEIDLSDCEFTTREKNGSLYVGTRKNDSDHTIKHGVVRQITNDGMIFEATYKNGSLHGIGRVIKEQTIQIQIHAH